MTKHRPSTKEAHTCSWCGYPGATHEGGYHKENGTGGESGWFCNAEHFSLWMRWRSAFTRVKAQQHITPFAEVSP